MLNVYVCEDNNEQRELIAQTIKNIILIENFDMELVLSTADPKEVIDFVKENKKAGFYFLDVNLSAEMDGISLAEKIRQYDPRGFIVFITTHGEVLELTFKHKIEAMDFIVKNDLGEMKLRIRDCIVSANEKYINATTELSKSLVIKVASKIVSFKYNEILCIETSASPHKLIIRTLKKRMEFSGSLSSVENLLDGRFFKCHKSTIINMDMVKQVDLKNNTIILEDDSQYEFASRLKGKIRKKLQ